MTLHDARLIFLKITQLLIMLSIVGWKSQTIKRGYRNNINMARLVQDTSSHIYSVFLSLFSVCFFLSIAFKDNFRGDLNERNEFKITFQ